jgi:hypothetical protein
LDVRGERGVELEVPGGLIADQVHDRAARAPRVVKIGDAVGEARPEVEQGQRGPVGHAAVAVGRTGADALEQTENRPDTGNRVERRDERHLGRARIREADLDARACGCPHQALGAVHGSSTVHSNQPEATNLSQPAGTRVGVEDPSPHG